MTAGLATRHWREGAKAPRQARRDLCRRHNNARFITFMPYIGVGAAQVQTLCQLRAGQPDAARAGCTQHTLPASATRQGAAVLHVCHVSQLCDFASAHSSVLFRRAGKSLGCDLGVYLDRSACAKCACTNSTQARCRGRYLAQVCAPGAGVSYVCRPKPEQRRPVNANTHQKFVIKVKLLRVAKGNTCSAVLMRRATTCCADACRAPRRSQRQQSM